jgi:SecD/SecF fusion protein
MEKNKRWHLGLIAAVMLLAVYNILPTVFYYSKPLNEAIGEKQALKIEQDISSRLSQLGNDSTTWIHSFSKLLHIKPAEISQVTGNEELVEVKFKTENDAKIFKKYLPRAGESIAFLPAQLKLAANFQDNDLKTVLVQRRFGVTTLDEPLYRFSSFYTAEDQMDPLYKEIIQDRLTLILDKTTGTNENAELLQLALKDQNSPMKFEYLTLIADNILNYEQTLSHEPLALKRFYATLTQGNFENKLTAVQQLTEQFEQFRERVKNEKVKIIDAEKKLLAEGLSLEAVQKDQLSLLIAKEEKLLKTITLLKKNTVLFTAGKKPAQLSTIDGMLGQLNYAMNPTDQVVSLQGLNPTIESFSFNTSTGKVTFKVYDDLTKVTRETKEKAIERLVIGEIAKLSRVCNETITPINQQFELALHSLDDAKSLIALDLNAIAKTQTEKAKTQIATYWNPTSSLLKEYRVVTEEEWNTLPAIEKRFAIVFATSNHHTTFAKGSLYVILKGIAPKVEELSKAESSETSQVFFEDLNHLLAALRSLGYTSSAKDQTKNSEYKDDLIFENQEFYLPLLMATREKFEVHGSKKFAVLEMSNLRQRIHVQNKIENREQEELLKWRDEYLASQIQPERQAQFDIPKPTKNPLWTNFLLSSKKYFRGDERKILNWGLDLSGGKTVEIALKDHSNHKVTDESDIKVAINELFERVNKMGVSEVAIRQEGDHITLDFPGSQELSAQELIRSSSMTFHIVNEKFTPQNSYMKEHVSRFLQDVWNEAVMTNQKDAASINAIAWNLLYGDPLSKDIVHPRTESARILYDQGLRLANPDSVRQPATFDIVTSSIALFKGDGPKDWQYQTHPLLFVFNEHALEGGDLTNIRSGFDQQEGNFLSFDVKKSQTSSSGESINPQEVLAQWTATFSKDKLGGTEFEKYSGGHGYRMAVILNGYVISSPALNAAIRDSARITGQFSQHDINKLESDLKAGSLTFTPQILSEKNVSPDLGVQERFSGILATGIALSLVIVTMIGYYRFAGLIASIAVVLNLLIMWATLQNIQATITLPVLAGIVLTVGMAVDANVLVFERIKEEMKQHGKLSLAIQNGFQKAFSAIVDSNITTIIAAVVLLNFNSGPIKGVATTLIIGIVSSMFTALFLTRCFFRAWLVRSKNRKLNMMNWIQAENLNFLKYSKLAFMLTAACILVGGYFFAQQRQTVFGMDFTGGYALNVTVAPQKDLSYKETVETALLQSGIAAQDFDVRELTPTNTLRIFLSKVLEQPGRALSNENLSAFKDSRVEYSSNADSRIEWIASALESHGVPLSSGAVDEIEGSWTNVSGQMSDSMRNQAVIGILIALAGILAYISVRFEFKFALAATIGLAVDVLVTLAFVGILNAFGVPVQIDLSTVAALVTIVGYSLNDTIIVFDRIREDSKLTYGSTLLEIANKALNTTLSRTLLTSGTTMLVLLALVCLGGSSIFGFSLVMTLGVVIGTFSTFYIATPLLIYFEKKESTHSTAVLSLQ